MPQTTFSCNRSSSGWEQENHPVRRMSLCTTTATTSAGSRSPGHPSTWAYRKPWNVVRGSHTSSPVPASTYSSRASAARSGRVLSSPSSSTSAWCSTTVLPRSPRTRIRNQPTRFCPKSSTVRPDGRGQHLMHRDLLDPSRARRRPWSGHGQSLDHPDRRPACVVEPRLGPPGRHPGRVEGLARVDAAARDRALTRRPPRSVGHHRPGRAVLAARPRAGSPPPVGRRRTARAMPWKP